jgi:hypothetical protein
MDIATVGHIDDIKRTGFYAGVHTCSLCGLPTPANPIRMSWYKKGDSSGCGDSYQTGIFDDVCAEEIHRELSGFVLSLAT